MLSQRINLRDPCTFNQGKLARTDGVERLKILNITKRALSDGEELTPRSNRELRELDAVFMKEDDDDSPPHVLINRNDSGEFYQLVLHESTFDNITVSYKKVEQKIEKLRVGLEGARKGIDLHMGEVQEHFSSTLGRDFLESMLQEKVSTLSLLPCAAHLSMHPCNKLVLELHDRSLKLCEEQIAFGDRVNCVLLDFSQESQARLEKVAKLVSQRRDNQFLGQSGIKERFFLEQEIAQESECKEKMQQLKISFLEKISEYLSKINEVSLALIEAQNNVQSLRMKAEKLALSRKDYREKVNETNRLIKEYKEACKQEGKPLKIERINDQLVSMQIAIWKSGNQASSRSNCIARELVATYDKKNANACELEEIEKNLYEKLKGMPVSSIEDYARGLSSAILTVKRLKGTYEAKIIQIKTQVDDLRTVLSSDLVGDSAIGINRLRPLLLNLWCEKIFQIHAALSQISNQRKYQQFSKNKQSMIQQELYRNIDKSNPVKHIAKELDQVLIQISAMRSLDQEKIPRGILLQDFL